MALATANLRMVNLLANFLTKGTYVHPFAQPQPLVLYSGMDDQMFTSVGLGDAGHRARVA